MFSAIYNRKNGKASKAGVYPEKGCKFHRSFKKGEGHNRIPQSVILDGVKHSLYLVQWPNGK